MPQSRGGLLLITLLIQKCMGQYFLILSNIFNMVMLNNLFQMGMTPAEKKKYYAERKRQKKKEANAKHRAKKKAEEPPKPPKALSQTKGAIAVRKCREKKKQALFKREEKKEKADYPLTALPVTRFTLKAEKQSC